MVASDRVHSVKLIKDNLGKKGRLAMGAEYLETRKELPSGLSNEQLEEYIKEGEKRADVECEIVEEGGKQILVCRYKKPNKRDAEKE